MLKVDFHTHTYHSPDSITRIQALIDQAKLRGLDRIVVTDHNRLAGALEACQMDTELVIPGEEVQTTEGEFLAAFVSREIPRGLEPLEALKQLREQGAFISMSHPFDYQRSGWSRSTLEELVPLVDAIETHNARVLSPAYNTAALEFARKWNLPGTAGSDAHHPSEVGNMYSLLPDFHDADSLRQAIRKAENFGRLASPFVHGYSSWARITKKLGTSSQGK